MWNDWIGGGGERGKQIIAETEMSKTIQNKVRIVKRIEWRNEKDLDGVTSHHYYGFFSSYFMLTKIVGR